MDVNIKKEKEINKIDIIKEKQKYPESTNKKLSEIKITKPIYEKPKEINSIDKRQKENILCQNLINEKKRVFASVIFLVLMISILILKSITLSHSIDKILSNLENFKEKFSSEDKYELFFNFLNAIKDLIKKHIYLFIRLIKESLIQEIRNILNTNNKYQIAIVIIACFTIMWNIIFILIICFCKVLNLLCIGLNALINLLCPLILLILSIIALNKLKEIKLFEESIINEFLEMILLKAFNGYIKGFKGREIAVIIISSFYILFGIIYAILESKFIFKKLKA